MASVLQDTTDVRRRIEKRRRARRGQATDSLSARGGERAAGDTLAEGSDALLGEPFPSPDSIMLQLMRRPGFRPVVYRGDTLRFMTRDQSIHIRERARIERAGEELTADSIVYEGGTRYMTAYGESKLVNAKGEEITSDEGPFFYNTDTRIGTVVDGRTKWELWNVRGDFTLEGTDTLWVKHGSFTTCNLAEPHYHFEADRIKLVLGHIVVAWPVRLYFGDVPVFWFPFFAQDVRAGRHSGILPLRFGVNDIVENSSGHDRHISNIGYYWAISDYTDAQLALDWWSNRWTRIDGFFRYRWRRQFLNGRMGYSQFFLPDGERQLSLTWNHSQRFGERSDLNASVQFVSSRQFQRENEFNPDRLVQQLRSDVGLTRRFDWGTVNLSGQQVRPLTENARTTLNLPQLSVTFAPLVPFRARSPLEARWYNSLSLNGSMNFQRQWLETPGQPDQNSTSGGLTTSWALGNLRSGGSANYRDNVIEKPDTLITPDTSIVAGDTVITQDTTLIGPEVKEGTIDWRTSLGYQQRLIGSTTLTPALDVSGSFFRSNETGLDFVSGPTRLSMNARLNTDLYGFFPGVGSVQRIRHKFSPRLTWTYSPEVTPSAEIASLRGFSAASVRERHQLSVGLSQTFEAKLKPRRDESAEDDAEPDTARTRRPSEGRKLTLMAIRTTAIAYDFVEGEIATGRLTNNITSDLLRGLTVRLAHDLFEETADGRNFDPFLSELNLNFSIGDRALGGLLGRRGAGVSRGRGILPETRPFEDPAADTAAQDTIQEPERPAGPRRPWNLSLDYSLIRRRPVDDGATTSGNQQSIRPRLGFSPTDNWTITWRTQYDLERNQFVDHVLSLRRDLHRWSATFAFLQAANGNFVFEFEVRLNDLPDIKFDFREEDRR